MAPGDEWPPHENPSLQADIKENMDFLSDLLEKQVDSAFETEPIGDDTQLWDTPTILMRMSVWFRCICNRNLTGT